MKQKTLPKSFFLAISSFSLAAFLFVNVHAGLNLQQKAPGAGLAQSKVEENEDQHALIRIPDITVLGRIMDVVHKAMDKR
jgi:hypothetical protein